MCAEVYAGLWEDQSEGRERDALRFCYFVRW
jgi:hypothetical protein